MDDYKRFNKVSGVRWIKTPIEDLKIRIRIKPHDNTLSFTRFENYMKNSNLDEENLNSIKEFEEYEFKWQQKVFSPREFKRYSDIHNCVTETELKYYDYLRNSTVSCNKIYTYTNEDEYMRAPWQEKEEPYSKNITNLISCLQKISLSETLKTNLLKDNISARNLFKSEENISENYYYWTAMHIVFDNSEYNKRSELALKQDAILASLYWNEENRCLVISPDVNSLEWNPYVVETKIGEKWDYQYAVEVELQSQNVESGDSEELMKLLKKLQKRWNEKNRLLLRFIEPSIGTRQYHIFLEILSAIDFEENNLYIEYNIKLPEGVECNDVLKGKTHTAQYFGLEDGTILYNFAHNIDIFFNSTCNKDIAHIDLYLEAISQDWWGRHRTEGYAHSFISTDPSRYCKSLDCVRPEEKDRVYAESRRYFIGGCNLLDDLEILAKPLENEPSSDFRYVSTGKINVRWHVLRQAQSASMAQDPMSDKDQRISCSTLLVGADAALRRYRRARATLAAAARGLDLPPDARIGTPDETDNLESTEEFDDKSSF